MKQEPEAMPRATHTKKNRPHVVIIGGGVMGCAAAYELSRRGVPVTVLERSVPGAEASSAAAGILGAQVESHQPGPLTELALASRRLFPELATELERASGISIGYRRSGVLRVAYDSAQLGRAARELAWQKKAKLPLERLTRAALLRREPCLSRELSGGLWFEDDATLEPRALLSALRISAEKAGAQFRSG